MLHLCQVIRNIVLLSLRVLPVGACCTVAWWAHAAPVSGNQKYSSAAKGVIRELMLHR